MGYALKDLTHNTYLDLGIEDFREAQIAALGKARLLKADVVVINEDDDYFLCVAVFERGEAHLSLSTSGLKDTPIAD